MLRICLLSFLLCAAIFGAPSAKPNAVAPFVTPISVYGAWHCGNEFCSWASVRNMTDFDTRNRWLINRGDGTPSVNLVVLSFVHPLRLLNKTTDSGTTQGIPNGMTQAVVDYFKTRGIRVQMSIGGITYTDAWNQALATNPVQLGLNAAEAAQRFGVGIEIDYEENTNPNLPALEAFINAYRSVHPYDASGNNHAARLTIDLAAGDRFLIALTRKATADWLNTTTPVLDYANAMVPNRQPNSAADAQANWQEHVDGKPQFGPPILPLAPAKFTGGLYIVTGNRAAPECTSFSSSLINSTGAYVQSVAPNGAGTTSG
ncbi:MAG TPA: hypothetical protein VFP47_01190, partial [Pyrinomonadaceae bacterium]|nr:hypothetical protein [Pyrinomonadaceae bacterium]